MVAVLNGKVRAGVTELLLSRLIGGERVGHADIWGTSVLGRGNSACRGTRTGTLGVIVEWQGGRVSEEDEGRGEEEV